MQLFSQYSVGISVTTTTATTICTSLIDHHRLDLARNTEWFVDMSLATTFTSCIVCGG